MGSATKMTYIVSGGALNSTHSRHDMSEISIDELCLCQRFPFHQFAFTSWASCTP